MENKKFWHIISKIGYPVFAPVLAVVFFFILTGQGQNYSLLNIFIMVFSMVVFMVLIPFVVIYILKKKGRISGVELYERRDRTFPLILTLLMLVLCFRILYGFDVSTQLLYSFAASSISIFLAYFLLRITKVSLHAIGSSGLLSFVFVLCMSYVVSLVFALCLLFILFLFYSLVIVARLEIKAHTRWELVWGTLAGSVPQLAILFAG